MALQRVSTTVLPYVAPRNLRHAIGRQRVWVLNEVASHPDSRYSVDGFFKFRCVFFHVPKTGGLAVSEAIFGNRAAGHVSVSGAKILVGARGFRRFFKFCFVRNPWDRLVSTYHYLRGGSSSSPITDTVRRCTSFEEFVISELRTPRVAREQHLRPQHSFIVESRGELAMDFVGRFESLANDFQIVARQIGVTAELRHVNASARGSYQAYYTREMRDLVGEIYSRDIELFGYDFGQPYAGTLTPQQW